jgi:hypothetical protein
MQRDKRGDGVKAWNRVECYAARMGNIRRRLKILHFGEKHGYEATIDALEPLGFLSSAGLSLMGQSRLPAFPCFVTALSGICEASVR